MTNEEAGILIEKTKPTDNSAMSIMLREAINMAIKALKQNSILNKIKAEIEKQVLKSLTDGDNVDDWFAAVKVNECLEIIDKYKESEDKEQKK